ncbi:MAG: hypothetical protein K2W82_01605 [Candidatus Obscuribacterales bacterium]|nr:hypothetical protein [Candidatus Obscuribacterales bacterium]
MPTVLATNKAALNQLFGESKKLSLAAKLLSCLLPAAFAFIFSLLNNFVFPVARIMLATDGKHYLTTLQLFCSSGLLKGHPDLAVCAWSGMGGHLLIDGPLMLLFYGMPFSFLNHALTPRDWPLMACGQSLIHAVSALFVAIIARRITNSALFSFIAGLLWAAYPNAVLQTGHFMTETPATFLLLAILLLLSGSIKRPVWSAISAALLAALVVIGKPALGPAVALALFYAAMQSKKKMLTVFLMVATAAMTVLPWTLYFQAITGKIYLTAQRLPVYNVAKGWNVEADGWGYNPHPPLTALYGEEDGPLNTAYGLIVSHPTESARLALRKTSRLFSLPWNDFKNRVLGLDMNVQILIHRLLLCVGLFGFALFVVRGYKKLNPASRLPLEIAIIFCLGHLTYVMVESTARYSFTAMPFVVLLAGYGLWQAGNMQQFAERSSKVILMVAACLAIVATAVLVHIEKLTLIADPKACPEYVLELNRNQSVEKIFDFSDVSWPDKIKTAFILIDADKEIEKADIFVQGNKLVTKPVSAIHLDAARYQIFDQMREFAPSMGINAEDLRQWRFVVVPLNWLQGQKKFSVRLQSRAKKTLVYVDSKPDERYMLSPSYCNYGLLASSPMNAGAESRYTDPVTTAAVKQNSFIGEKALAGSLRIKLALVLPPESQTESQAVTQAETNLAAKTTISIGRDLFDPLLSDVGSADYLRMNKTILYAARSNAGEVKLPELKAGTHFKFRITGELKANQNPGEVGLLSVASGAGGQQVILGRTPRALTAKSKWQKFVIEDLLPGDLFVSAGNGMASASASASANQRHLPAPRSLSLAFYPGPWMEGQYGASRKSCDVLFRKLQIEYQSCNLPEFAARKIIYY